MRRIVLPGREIVALAEHGGHLGAAVAARDQRVGAGRLEDDDLRRDAALARQLQVLRPRAEDDRLAVAAAGPQRRRDLRAVVEDEARFGAAPASASREGSSSPASR